jgi:hypothetical protein
VATLGKSAHPFPGRFDAAGRSNIEALPLASCEPPVFFCQQLILKFFKAGFCGFYYGNKS